MAIRTIIIERASAGREAEELPRSGSAYSSEQAYGLALLAASAINPEDHFDDMFLFGFMAGLQFSSIPEGAETHGMTAGEFAANAHGNAIENVIGCALKRISGCDPWE